MVKVSEKLERQFTNKISKSDVRDKYFIKDLENITTYFDMMTTNASSLQIGFFVFTSFALLSAFIANSYRAYDSL